MSLVSEGKYALEFLISEAAGNRSRDVVTIGASQTLHAGDILGHKTKGAATVTPTAAAGNTGNGAIGTWTSDAGAPAGDYKLLCIEPASNLGKFAVYKPDGTLDGVATVGTAYNGTINGTIADGATDFVSGDYFTINVAYAAVDQYFLIDPEGTDGTEVAVAILAAPITTAVSETPEVLVIARDAEVTQSLLGFSDADTTEKAAIVAQMAAVGIICR